MKKRRLGLKYIKHKENPTSFSKGYTPWNKGMKLSEEHKNNMKGKRDKVSMENNPNWKGGISTEDYKQRRVFRNTMQKSIFERDNYTCQLCGSNKDLQVDHIQPWSEYVELRFKMENCRTLCAKCHYFITYNRPMPANLKGWGHNLMERGGD